MNSNKNSSDKSATNAGTPRAEPEAQSSGQLRKNQLYLKHPDGSPLPVAPMDYLLHCPSRLASTASWISYRDKTLLPLMRDRPDDPNLPLFLEQAEKVLAWRAEVPPEDRFWKPD